VRQNWSLFIAGLALVVMAAFFMPRSQAETSSESDASKPSVTSVSTPLTNENLGSVESGSSLASPKEDLSLSGLKTQVPQSSELETNLQKREKELTAREQRLKEFEDRVKAEEDRVKIRIEDLEKLQSEINAQEEKYKQVDQAIVSRLVKTIETMQPKKASLLMAGLEDEVAIEMSLKLKEKKLAAILDVMDPVRATQISTLLYKRRPAAAGRVVASDAKKQGAGLAPKK
jgi:flagellar motility protein MotE (MotC chaperone)